MCNQIKKGIQPIKEKGFGYKIFIKKDKKLFGPFSSKCYDKIKGWIIWNNSKSADKDDGFCFFTNKKEAKKLLTTLHNYSYGRTLVIHKIEYKKGLGKQSEKYCNCKYKHALCREFKILEEII